MAILAATSNLVDTLWQPAPLNISTIAVASVDCKPAHQKHRRVYYLLVYLYIYMDGYIYTYIYVIHIATLISRCRQENKAIPHS